MLRSFSLAVGAAFLLSWSAHAASTIDPTQPAQGTPYSPAPIRLNFEHAANDINALPCNPGVSPPSNPAAGNCWLQTPQGGTTYTVWIWDGRGNTWLPVAALDTVNNIWMPPIGGGLLPNILSGLITDLGTVPQASVYVTGVNMVQSFGASAPAGSVKIVNFTDAATLVENPTSMILPGGTNIIQQAGDVAIALHLGSGNWKVLFDSEVGGVATLPACSFTAPGAVPPTGGDATKFLSANCTFVAPTPTPPAGPCSSAAAGLVPATGGGTTNFLRADCTFALPPPPPSSPCGANPNANLGFFPVLIEMTSYTVKLTDQCSLIVYEGPAGAIFTLPPPTMGFVFWVINLSSDGSDLTLFPPSGTINLGGSVTIPRGSGGMLDSDGTNS